MQNDASTSAWHQARDRFVPAHATAVACAFLFALSALVALGWARARGASAPAASARVAAWVSDRDADRVIGLDRNLLVVRSVAVRAPIEVEARADGGVWVLSSTHADPLGRHQLLRLAADGQVVAHAQLASIFDLCSDEFGHAGVVDFDPSGETVHVFDAAASPIWLRAWPGALCIAVQGQRVLVGTMAGELALFDMTTPASAPLRLAWGGAISDVAPGPTFGSWWALDSHGSCRLALLDPGLVVIWSRSVGLHVQHLAPEKGVERVWIADTTQPHVRRFGPGGVLEIDRADMPLGGLDRAATTGVGSALFTAPGALLRLDAQGQNSPGQAGFDFLVDVASLP
ncbi:MAG: hypothetical protein ABI054_07615 [Planctomycetota bacterium]